jgi:ornithine carbamoyltransferase
MQALLNPRELLGLHALSSRGEVLVLSTAAMLREAARAGTGALLLRGKKLGLLCAVDDHPDALLFRRAATDLGAHVASIRASLAELQTLEQVRSAARMLGRLYDAVECQDMHPDLVRQVATDAGVPVYAGMACRAHPAAGLAERLGDEATPGENRRFIVQALLLSTLL